MLLIILSSTFLIWCEQSKYAETTLPDSSYFIKAASEVENNYTIGWSVYNSQYEFFADMQQGVIDKAEELGLDIILHDQKSSTTEMVTGVIKLLEQGIDALVISPFNPRAMPIIVNMANEMNIPVIVVDIGTGGTDIDAFIISDSFGGGVYAGEYALALIDKYNIDSKNIAILKVEETSEYARRRGEGFKNVMHDRNYITVSEITANSETIEGYNAMKLVLETYKDDLAVVFAENDRMALGAAKAIEEAGKKGDILVIGFDGIPSAIEAINEGRMQGTIAQQQYNMGQLGVEYAKRILLNEPIVFDDLINKQLFSEVYLIDEDGLSIK